MKKISRRLFSVIAFAMILLLNSCGKDEPSPGSMGPIVTDRGTPRGDLRTASIGAAGGSLQSADGRVSVVILQVR